MGFGPRLGRSPVAIARPWVTFSEDWAIVDRTVDPGKFPRGVCTVPRSSLSGDIGCKGIGAGYRIERNRSVEALPRLRNTAAEGWPIEGVFATRVEPLRTDLDQ